MKTLHLEPTVIAQWRALLSEAEQRCDKVFGVDLESYLVFLLMRFSNQPEIAKSLVGLEFLESAHTIGKEQHQRLRDVGDKCLLFSGFFPGIAEKRCVSVSYFVELGQTAYYSLACSPNSRWVGPCFELCEAFVPMMDVLQTMQDMSREHPLLSPLDAMELWEHTASEHALKSLQKQTVSSGSSIITRSSPDRNSH